jgi:hypothetical protein
MMLTKQQQFFNINNPTPFKSWGKFGVEINLNRCNTLSVIVFVGLKILVSPVQVWFSAYFKTSPSEGFVCFYSFGYLSPDHFEDNYWSTLDQPKTA